MYVSFREWMKCMFCSILWDLSTWQTPFTRRVLLTKHSCKSPHVSSLSGVRNQVQWEFVYCNFLGNKVSPYRWVNKKPRMEGATKKRKQIFCEASGAFQENCNWNVSVVKVPSPIAHLLVILVLKNVMSSSLHTIAKAIFLGLGVALGGSPLDSHESTQKLPTKHSLLGGSSQSVSKLVTPIYKPFMPFGRGAAPVRGLTITMVINHTSPGMILQACSKNFPLPHLNSPCAPATTSSDAAAPAHKLCTCPDRNYSKSCHVRVMKVSPTKPTGYQRYLDVPGRKWMDQWWSDEWVSYNLLINGVFLGVEKPTDPNLLSNSCNNQVWQQPGITTKPTRVQ